MQKPIIKKSKYLNQLLDELYDQYVLAGKFGFLKKFLQSISDAYYDNDYLGVAEYVNCGVKLTNLSIKIKKPIYRLHSTKGVLSVFFVDSYANIKKKLLSEKSKFDAKVAIKNTVQNIDGLDASILAYLALVPKPLNDLSILNFLSKKNLPLGKCLLGEKGKYSKDVLAAAKIYNDWAIYRIKPHPSRKNLNLALIASVCT